MRVDRELLKIFLTNLRIRKFADEETLTDNDLVEEIATFFETNERAINFNHKKQKPFSANHETNTNNYQ